MPHNQEVIKVADILVHDSPITSEVVAKPTLTPEAARDLVNLRWERTSEEEAEVAKLWNSLPLDEAIKRLAFLRAECERASNILNARMTTTQDGKVTCVTCGKLARDNEMVFTTAVKNQAGIYYNIFCCTANCYSLYNNDRLKKKRLALETGETKIGPILGS